MAKKKELFRRTEQTQKVVDRLLSAKVGDTVSWRELSDILDSYASERN